MGRKKLNNVFLIIGGALVLCAIIIAGAVCLLALRPQLNRFVKNKMF